MDKIKVLELPFGMKVCVGSDGTVASIDHTAIRSNGRIDNRKGKRLKPGIDKYGYKRVILTKNGLRKTYQVHRLVAMAFIPNPLHKETVNHIDGNKANNNVSNLEWATPKEQTAHAWKHNLAWKKRDDLGRFLSKEVVVNE